MNREELIERARLAEIAERYEDMVGVMKKVVALGDALTTDERNLLSVAYKNIIGSKRTSWRVICSMESKHPEDSSLAKQVVAYREKIEGEVSAICEEVLELLNGSLIPEDTDSLNEEPLVEAAVFYLKMKGDYCRYQAEVSPGDKKSVPKAKAEEAYTKAFNLAQSNLKSTNPIRLGLALNYSVFFYEIMNQQAEACKVAKKAFDDAISDLDSLPEDSYKDSTLIMQLIRDNLTLWTSEAEDDAKVQDLE